MRFAVVLVVVAVLGLAVLGGAAWWLTDGRGPSPEELAEATAADYLTAWEDRRWAAMAQVTLDESAEQLADAHEELLGNLEVTAATYTAGEVEVDEGQARVPFDARLDVDGVDGLAYSGVLELVAAGDDWLVDWSPQLVHPSLGEQRRLEQVTSWGQREAILAHDGSPLVDRGEVVLVGVEPRRVEDPDEVAAALAEAVDADPDDVLATLERDDLVDDWLYPFAEVRPAEADQISEELLDVPGTVLRESAARVAPTEAFARHVLGGTGEVTAELLEEFGAPYEAGQTVGRSGLERVFERRLAGEPDTEVRVVDADGEVVEVLEQVEGADPRPVHTTLDADVQLAAEAALDAVAEPAAIVALDAATGEIRASASRPLDDFDRALGGRYPPGSTFKVVTTQALLAQGKTPDDPVDCPGERVVSGRTFTNAGDRELGDISFAEAFAESCNTAFVDLAIELDPAALGDAAARFGFGEEPDLPLPAAGGRFPDPGDAVEHAAAAIGQGRVDASPLAMAGVAAAVADGAWRPPRLLAGGDPDEARELPTDDVGTLRDLMRAAVADGTGEEADVAGEPVAGKTGTAEFGDDDPPEAHAWFIGFRGGLAFAVLVEGGGSGGDVAAPVAADFLEALDA